MANVIQFQRRALESLLTENQKSIAFLDIDQEKQYFLIGNEAKEIFLLGVSEGIGTCSDLHNVNIAVFSFFPPFNNQPRFPKGAKCAFCNASALVRVPLLEEWSDENQPYLVVEGIELWSMSMSMSRSNQLMIFVKTGKKALYADLI